MYCLFYENEFILLRWDIFTFNFQRDVLCNCCFQKLELFHVRGNIKQCVGDTHAYSFVQKIIMVSSCTPRQLKNN
jgi:hypothetical protein